MKIVRVELHEVELPLIEPFEISGGIMPIRRSLIVRIEDSGGREGLGEAAPFELPFYSDETIGSARSALINELLPGVVGETLDDFDDLERLVGDTGTHPMARAGLDLALWDLLAAERNKPMLSLVTERLEELRAPANFLRELETVETGIALGIPASRSVDDLVYSAQQAALEGYKRIKIKIRAGWDREVVEKLMAAVPDVPLWVDANGAYRPTEDRKSLLELCDSGIALMEQPYPAQCIVEHLELAAAAACLVCADESLPTVAVADRMAERPRGQAWNIKLQRLGGLEQACRVVAVGARAGIPMWVGYMPETGVGARCGLALAGRSGFALPTDIEPSRRWFADEDLFPIEMIRPGELAVQTDAGHRPDLLKNPSWSADTHGVL